MINVEKLLFMCLFSWILQINMVSFDEMKPNTVTIVLESRGSIGFVQVNGNNFRVLVTTKGGYLID